MILPIIMAGGLGTRLWPMSRQMYPKQFLNIIGDNTMLQDTVKRLTGLNAQKPYVICNNEHRFLVAEQLREFGGWSEIILEPEGRNTAPAIALAAIQAMQQGEDPLLLVLAADHIIQNTTAFTKVIKQAEALAQQGRLVTFGITATSPETGYGYIHRDKALNENSFLVKQFVEKPCEEKAQAYVNSGEYFWNSGMFLFKASRYLEELKKYQPDMLDICQQSIDTAHKDLDFIRIDEKIFSQCPSESIDYAVMEPLCDNELSSVTVFPLDAGWSDIGSWSEIWKVSPKDEYGNYILGDVITLDSQNCLVYGEDRLVSILGLDDIVVVDTKNTILVANKNKVKNVKQIIEQLKLMGKDG